MVAGKRSSAGIGAVHAGGKTDDTATRVPLSESRHRTGEIVRVLSAYIAEKKCETLAAYAFGCE